MHLAPALTFGCILPWPGWKTSQLLFLWAHTDLQTLTILLRVAQFLNFSHGLTTRSLNLTVFWEISFWYEMLPCWIKKEILWGMLVPGLCNIIILALKIAYWKIWLCQKFCHSDDLFSSLLKSIKEKITSDLLQ